MFVDVTVHTYINFQWNAIKAIHLIWLSSLYVVLPKHSFSFIQQHIFSMHKTLELSIKSICIQKDVSTREALRIYNKE